MKERMSASVGNEANMVLVPRPWRVEIMGESQPWDEAGSVVVTEQPVPGLPEDAPIWQRDEAYRLLN